MYFDAAVLVKKNKVDIMKLSLPKLKYGQSLIKILYTSICHTQLQEINGLRGKDNYLPHCLGHEATGIVIDKHSSVKKINNLDNVCLSWINSKGINSGGTHYTNLRGEKVNAGPVHTFSEYAVISENKIYKIKKKKKEKVLLGCAFPTAYNVVDSLNQKTIKSICVLGCGGLGIASIIAAKDYKIKNITAVDFNEQKLKFANSCGAKVLYNNFNKIEANKSCFDVILECTGNIDILKKSIEFTKKFGGKVVVIGNYPKGQLLKIDPWHIIQGKTLTGAWNNQLVFDNKFKKFEKKIENKRLNFFFGKKTYNLNNINHAIKDFKKGKMIRPLIKL